MKNAKKLTSFNQLFSRRENSWSIVLLTAFIITFGSLILIYGIWSLPKFKVILGIRIVHAMAATIILLSGFFLNEKWKDKLGPFFFLALICPIFINAWFQNEALMASSVGAAPFRGMPVVFLILAALVPYSYALNMILTVLFSLLIIIMWVFNDMSKMPQILPSGEPFFVLLFAFVSFCLLYFRHKTDLKLQRLMLEKTRNEFIKNLARVFLSLRDRSNTPLQSLLFFGESIKKGRSPGKDELEAFSRSLQSLKHINTLLIKYDKYIDWDEQPLMTDIEIEDWLQKNSSETNGNAESS